MYNASTMLYSTLNTSNDRTEALHEQSARVEIANAIANGSLKAYVSDNVNTIFGHIVDISALTRELITSCLDAFFGSKCPAVIDTYRDTIKELAKKFRKDTQERESLVTNFNTAILNGTGRLRDNGHRDTQGNVLYELDPEYCCIKTEKGKTELVSPSKFKTVRLRYWAELRELNLVRPRRYSAKKANDRNRLALLEDLKALRKTGHYDDDALARLNAIIEREDFVLVEGGRDKVAA